MSEGTPEDQRLAAEHVRAATEELNRAIHRAATLGVETELDTAVLQSIGRTPWLQVAVVTKVRV